MIVTLDGPAGAGKSTIARALARTLGIPYLDTGALYRAVAWAALEAGINLSDEPALESLATNLELRQDDGRMFVGDRDVSDEIRTPAVTDGSSRIAVHAGVRAALLGVQREFAAGGTVADGRDMGTVVFPTADVKIFLDATAEERAERRWRELKEKGVDEAFSTVLADIRLRDARDMGRDVAPLKQAEGAIYLETTGLTIAEVVAKAAMIVDTKRNLKTGTTEPTAPDVK